MEEFRRDHGRLRRIQPAPLGCKRPRMDKERIKLAMAKERSRRPNFKQLDTGGLAPGESMNIVVSQLTAKVWCDRRSEQGFTSDDEFAWWLLRAAANFEYQNRTWSTLTTSHSPQLDDRRSSQIKSPPTLFDLDAGGTESAGVSHKPFCNYASRMSLCQFHQEYTSSVSILSAKPDDLRHCFKCGSSIRRCLSKSGVLYALICRRGHAHHVTLELAMGYKQLRCEDDSQCSLCTLWLSEGSETTQLLSNFISSTTGKGGQSSKMSANLQIDEKQLREASPTTEKIVQPNNSSDSASLISAKTTEPAEDVVINDSTDQQASNVHKDVSSASTEAVHQPVQISKAFNIKPPIIRQLRHVRTGIWRQSLEQQVASQPLIRGISKASSKILQSKILRTSPRRIRPKQPNAPEGQCSLLPPKQETHSTLASVASEFKTSSIQSAPEYRNEVLHMPTDHAGLLRIAPNIHETFLRLTPKTQRVNPSITLKKAWPSILRCSDVALQPPRASNTTETASFRREDNNVGPLQVVEVKMVPCQDGYELESCEPVASVKPTHRYKSILKLRVDEPAVVEEPKEFSVVGSSTDVYNSAEGLSWQMVKTENSLKSMSTEVNDVSIFEPIVKMELSEVEDERNISDLSEDELERVNGMGVHIS